MQTFLLRQKKKHENRPHARVHNPSFIGCIWNVVFCLLDLLNRDCIKWAFFRKKNTQKRITRTCIYTNVFSMQNWNYCYNRTELRLSRSFAVPLRYIFFIVCFSEVSEICTKLHTFYLHCENSRAGRIIQTVLESTVNHKLWYDWKPPQITDRRCLKNFFFTFTFLPTKASGYLTNWIR